MAAEAIGFAASFCRKNLRMVLETIYTQTHSSDIAAKWTRKRLVNTILTRIERIDSTKRVIHAG
jgi:hypothetical protein